MCTIVAEAYESHFFVCRDDEFHSLAQAMALMLDGGGHWVDRFFVLSVAISREIQRGEECQIVKSDSFHDSR